MRDKHRKHTENGKALNGEGAAIFTQIHCVRCDKNKPFKGAVSETTPRKTVRWICQECKSR